MTTDPNFRESLSTWRDWAPSRRSALWALTAGEIHHRARARFLTWRWRHRKIAGKRAVVIRTGPGLTDASEARVNVYLRRDLAETWARTNPVLLRAELGLVVGHGVARLKEGDGKTPWNDLPYADEQVAD